MNCFKSLFFGIRNDYKAYAKESGSTIKPLAKIHYYCNTIFRFSHFFYQVRLLPVAKMLWLVNRLVFSIDIDPGAKLNGGFVIIHGVGIVIGRYVVSEGNFHIFQGATLGGNYGKKRYYKNILITQPYLENNIIIGMNAVVIGPVVLESGVKVGANAVVTKDMPAGSIVVGSNKILNK